MSSSYAIPTRLREFIILENSRISVAICVVNLEFKIHPNTELNDIDSIQLCIME